ncbi:unnamed protein product [Brachionus calyciflorus]|uniref:Uncharacterized protein n=1 Tax=Brachionus calyciflorus TaxID=104777 RepID=A0A813MB51_9BILA|nr:unnamed protein product [Brachionus calyciflorus]
MESLARTRQKYITVHGNSKSPSYVLAIQCLSEIWDDFDEKLIFDSFDACEETLVSLMPRTSPEPSPIQSYQNPHDTTSVISQNRTSVNQIQPQLTGRYVLREINSSQNPYPSNVDTSSIASEKVPQVAKK